MAKVSLWSQPRRSKKKKNKGYEYEGGAEKLLQFGDTHTGPRELERLKIVNELRRWDKARRAPTVAEIQQRYNYTEEFALRFLKKLEKAKSPTQNKRHSQVRGPTASFAEHVQQSSKPDSVGIAQTDRVVALPAEVQLKAVLEDIRGRYGDEIKQKGEQTSAREGFVYILTHPCFGEWVKGGMTIDYELRLGTYNTSDPLSRFQYAEVTWTPDRRKAERELLAVLQEVADETRGEWFKIDEQKALHVFRGLSFGRK